MSLSLTLAIAGTCIGCGGGTAKPEPKVAETRSAVPLITQSPSGDSVVIAADVRNLCNLGDGHATPRFDFDSAALRAHGREVLGDLATCLTTGPLKGKQLSLIGHADPRGELEYNFALGGYRANAVELYLESLGVSKTALKATSRGELDARGHDEPSWAADRRVDITLL